LGSGAQSMSITYSSEEGLPDIESSKEDKDNTLHKETSGCLLLGSGAQSISITKSSEEGLPDIESSKEDKDNTLHKETSGCLLGV